MPGLCHRSGGVSTVHCCFNSCSSASSSSASSCNGNGSSACNASNGIWSRSRDDITYAQLAKFWSDLPCAARQELLRIDKQSLFEQVRKNLYCSRCNGLLLEVYSQVVHYGRNLHHEVPCPTTGAAAGHGRYQNGNTSKFMVSSTHEDTGDPSVHPWGGLTATRDGILTLLDCFLVGTSLEALQNVFDSARARERERELLYPDACGGGGRGWISQGTSISGRGHGLKETCALHTARLSCDALVDFWSALGEETRLSLLRMKEEDFIERLMFRFDSKRFCRDCRRNVLREFKELKELKRTRREPRCNMWFCVADTAFQYEVSESSVQADWHEWFAEAGGIYARFEWALGTGEGKSDILGFEDVGLSESVQACGLALDNITACYITLRAWKHDGRCTEVSVKAHALEGRLCVHRRLIVGDGYVTITKGESIKKFFEHAEETEEEEDEESADRDGNDMDNEGSRFQKHAKSPELARDFLLDAATVIFKEQVEKAFREGTARQNAHNIFVCLALGLLEDRVHIACKEIITLEKQNKLLEEEAAEKREEEERKERRRQKEREKKLKKREKLKGKDKDRENNIYEAKASASSVDSINGEVLREEQDISVANGIETSTEAAADVFVPFSPMLADEAVDGCLAEDEKGNGENMSNLHADVHGEINSKDVSGGAFIFGPSKSSRRKSKIGKGNISEMSTIRLYRKSYPSMEINGHVRGSERFQSYPSMEVNGHVRGFERFQPASYSDVASRSIHGVARQSKSLKSEHFGKADTKSNLLKGYEKLNVPNGRGHYRYDYSFCGCNSQSSSKFTRDSRPDRVDSSLDLSRHFYRISNHPSGSVSDHCGVVKGKLKQGTGSGMRGEFVQKKVWEPLDLRQQVNKAASQPSNVLSSMSQNINAQTKADSSSVNSLPPVSDQSPSQCSKLNELPNNETGCISSNQLSTGSFETCVITSNSSQSDTRKHDDDTIQHPVSSSMPGSLVLDQLESDAAGDATAEKHVCSVESSTSEPLAVNNDLSTSTVDVSPAEMKMTDDSLLATHLNEPCNEKPNDSPARKDNVCVESGSNHGFQDISKNIPASNTFSKTEDVQLHVTEGRSQFESSSSHFINDYESNVLTRPISANHILNTPEITSTPQVLPMCLPSIAPPIIPLHPQHHQGYYQCSAAWHPISSNGLLPFPQHNGFMYPGQSPYGLSSTRLSPFSIPYSSIQPFPPVLASSQITSFPHQATTSNYNDLSNSLRSGESDTEAIKHGPGINLQLEKNSTLKEVSNGHPSAEVRSTQQDVTSSSSPENDSTNFSLFHFGGLDAVITGGSEGNSYSGGETVKQLISSNDTSVALLSNDFPSQQEQVPVEEYSLFAASRGSRLPFFNQVHNQVH